MPQFIKVMDKKDLPIGKSAIITAGGEEIALFNYKGKYYAISNQCLHQGSSLGEGRIEEGIVICPNHEWRYDLKTGQCPQNPSLCAKIYPVEVKEDQIQLRLENIGGKRSAQGKNPNKLPSSLKFNVPVIQMPKNPDEDLG